jgi:hypothetical protein
MQVVNMMQAPYADNKPILVYPAHLSIDVVDHHTGSCSIILAAMARIAMLLLLPSPPTAVAVAVTPGNPCMDKWHPTFEK